MPLVPLLYHLRGLHTNLTKLEFVTYWIVRTSIHKSKNPQVCAMAKSPKLVHPYAVYVWIWYIYYDLPTLSVAQSSTTEQKQPKGIGTCYMYLQSQGSPVTDAASHRTVLSTFWTADCVKVGRRVCVEIDAGLSVATRRGDCWLGSVVTTAVITTRLRSLVIR